MQSPLMFYHKVRRCGSYCPTKFKFMPLFMERFLFAVTEDFVTQIFSGADLGLGLYGIDSELIPDSGYKFNENFLRLQQKCTHEI